MTSEKTIARLSLYRRLLGQLADAGTASVYSHQLAKSARVTPAQVRRDVMAIGYHGSPSRGYMVAELIKSIDDFLDAPQGQRAALIGVGNLGRALVAYFSGRRPQLSLVAVFDRDPKLVGKNFHGCPCSPVEQFAPTRNSLDIAIAIIAVPASEAQAVADICVKAGIHGILNFAPVPLNVPATVYVDNIDLTVELEKVAFFARSMNRRKTRPAPRRR
ncbi:MAG: redox-sensing transcriptional repressor Rex [Planctomycetes bacterium]|nr:redox-sensing transcriptional repressor Rex [Planctomycetota bacterium]